MYRLIHLCGVTRPLHWHGCGRLRLSGRCSLRIKRLKYCKIYQHVWYVKSSDNPADIASRGIDPTKFQNHPLWWSGPTWLNQNSAEWPHRQPHLMGRIDLEERKVTAVAHAVVAMTERPLSSCSTLTKLLRVTAYCRRFMTNIMRSISKPYDNNNFASHLSSKELHDALIFWISQAQIDAFSDEMQRLAAEKQVINKSVLISLQPFIDEDGILRVYGRLRRAALHYHHRHPIILPKHHQVTKLIVGHAHAQTQHGNIQLMLNFLRQKYWILNARSLVKWFINNCHICHRLSATPKHQLMADFPSNPPAAPHFNGLAEAAVKSMKKHLIRIVGNVTLTYEELSTVLAQIEACLNSRPLCRLMDDPSQVEVLTPGHFLVGGPLLAPIEPNYVDEKSISNHWRRLQKMHQQIWKAWSIEYLTELQKRTKWQSRQPEPAVGDLIYVMDENLPPLRWPRGIITKLHPGDDGLSRVVTVKTATRSEMLRPVVKLCWVPMHNE